MLRPDNYTVQFNEALKFTHYGKIWSADDNSSNTIDMRAEVGLLSRHVIINGDISDGTSDPSMNSHILIHTHTIRTYSHHTHIHTQNCQHRNFRKLLLSFVCALTCCWLFVMCKVRQKSMLILTYSQYSPSVCTCHITHNTCTLNIFTHWYTYPHILHHSYTLNVMLTRSYILTYSHIHTHTHTHHTLTFHILALHSPIFTHTLTSWYIYTGTYIHIPIPTNTNLAYPYTYSYPYSYSHTHTHTDTYSYIHMHSHTHIYTDT